MDNSKIKVESPFNPDDGSLPYFYIKPNTPLEWICNYDEDNKILSIFKAPIDNKPAFQERYLCDINEAKRYRDELIKDGWKKGKVNIQIKKQNK